MKPDTEERADAPGHRGIALVTGAAGFIGRHLCRGLVSEGWEVHATSRQTHPIGISGLRQWQADFADQADARRLFAMIRPDVVFHLAGAVGPGPDMNLVLPTLHSLLTSTVNMLLTATELGCRRIVLAGSFTEPLPGSEFPTPGSPYGAAKWAGSAYGRMFHALYSSPVVILRPFMTYGPGQKPTKLIPTIIASVLRGEAPRLASGRVRADFVFIDDITEAFLAAARVPGVEGSTLDLGTGELVSIRTVVDEIVGAIGTDVAPLFGALPDRPAENEVAAVTGPAAQQLGWRARTSLADGLRQTINWYRGNPAASLDEPHYRSGAFNRSPP